MSKENSMQRSRETETQTELRCLRNNNHRLIKFPLCPKRLVRENNFGEIDHYLLMDQNYRMDQNSPSKRNEGPPSLRLNDHDDGYNSLLSRINFELGKILNNL